MMPARRLSNAGARRAAVALAMTMAACAANAAEFRGFVSDGPAGLLVFQPCSGASISARTAKVADKSPDTALTAGAYAVRQVMEDKARPLYVEFVGQASGDAVTVQRFQRAIGHVLACAAAPKDIVPGTRIAAKGPDGWRFVAAPSNAQLHVVGGKAARFPAASFVASNGAGRSKVYDAWSAQDGGTIRVEVTEEMCLDEQSETATGARVSVRYAGASLEGCAARF